MFQKNVRRRNHGQGCHRITPYLGALNTHINLIVSGFAWVIGGAA